jgi:hypothetical protein
MKKIPNLDSLLESNYINRGIIELDNFIGDLCEYGDELGQFSDPQKLFYFNQNLESEINNGGFSQYFYNSSGDNAHETILSLNSIGAAWTAGI